MKTVRDMYRAGGMNEEYGQGGMNEEYGMGGMNEYKKSGKMPKALLEYFKEKGKDKMKDYQEGGSVDFLDRLAAETDGMGEKYREPSYAQRLYDEASAVGMGLISLLMGEGELRDRYEKGYGAESQADFERSRLGELGKIDAALRGLSPDSKPMMKLRKMMDDKK